MPGLEDLAFGDNEHDQQEGEAFEVFQQKVGKMMYEQDQIIFDKVVKEEREKRLKEMQSKPAIDL